MDCLQRDTGRRRNEVKNGKVCGVGDEMVERGKVHVCEMKGRCAISGGM